MHPGEPEIRPGLVSRLVAAQFPEWAGFPATRVASSGTDNALFRLGETLVVRLPRLSAAVGGLEREQRWLPWLGPRVPVRIPELVAVGRPGEGFPWPWSVLSWLPGRNPGAGDTGLAGDLGEFVAALHRVEPAGGPETQRGRPLRTRDEPTREAIAQLGGDPACVEAWERALAAPDWTGAPVWLHADLSPGNVLVSGGALSAVLDFGTAGVGDPAVDLIPAWNLLPAAERETFREAVGADAATWERGRGWALSIAAIQLPYYRETNPVLARNARHTLEAVVD